MTSRTSRGAAGERADREAEPAEHQALARWVWLGRRALGLEPPLERRELRRILSECASLAIVETWLANGRNRTRTAKDLGISRRIVRRTVDAWEAAQTAAPASSSGTKDGVA